MLNTYLGSKISQLAGYNNGDGQSGLNSHKNIIVCGKNCWIISCSWKSIDVAAFVSEVGGLKEVPMVDALIAYDCPITHRTFLLSMKNVFLC